MSGATVGMYLPTYVYRYSRVDYFIFRNCVSVVTVSFYGIVEATIKMTKLIYYLKYLRICLLFNKSTNIRCVAWENFQFGK